MRIILHGIAWLIAQMPDSILESICKGFARIILLISKKRRQVIYSNLDHAFPRTDRIQLDAWTRTSTARMVEMGLLSFCSGAISEGAIQRRFTLDPEARAIHLAAQAKKKPIVVLVPHLTAMEMMPWLPHALPETLEAQVSCIYRPLENKTLDSHIRNNRTRFGMRLLSRKSGLNAAMKTLRSNGMVAILFDQNVRDSGVVTLFFNRVCTAPDLPGLMAQKFGASVLFAWFERTGFWQGTYRAKLLDERWLASPLHVTIGAQQRLESLLKQNTFMIPDWLWSHNRWRGQTEPVKRLRIDHKKNKLNETLALLGLTEVPRTFRLCLRLPDNHELAPPLFEAVSQIRQHRPDAWIILVAHHKVLAEAESAGVGDEWVSKEDFRLLSYRFIDTVITFRSATDEDGLIARMKTSQRFAATPKAKPRKGFTHTAPIPSETEPIEAAKLLLEHFGLPQ